MSDLAPTSWTITERAVIGDLASGGRPMPSAPQGRIDQTGLLLLAVLAAVLATALGMGIRSPRTARQRSEQASLLPPQRRWGLNRHERLHDRGYLRRMLLAEQQSPDAEPTEAPPLLHDRPPRPAEPGGPVASEPPDQHPLR